MWARRKVQMGSSLIKMVPWNIQVQFLLWELLKNEKLTLEVTFQLILIVMLTFTNIYLYTNF